MKSFAKLALVLPAFLLLMNAASAAFSFQISPASSLGTPQVLNILAVESTAPGFGPQFTLSSGSITTTGTPAFSYVLNLTGGFYTANAAGNPIGTITVTTAPGTASGTIGTVSFTGVIALSSNPALIVPGQSYSSLPATITAVPEPSSFALLGVAGLGFAVYRRRRAKAC